MSPRIIYAQFVITDYDEDLPLRLEDLRSNVKHVLSHAQDEIKFHLEGDEHFQRRVVPKNSAVLDAKELEQLRLELDALPTDYNLAGLQGGYVVALLRRLDATIKQWQREAWKDVPTGDEEAIDVEFSSCSEWKDHEWELRANGFYHCTKCDFEKTYNELAQAAQMGCGEIRIKEG